MAFNPFHTFRKNSKVVFAGLTILCMATFILSSGMGKGDFFSQITETFGGRTGPTLATINGKNYSGRDIEEVNARRRFANDYMDAAIVASRQALEERVGKTVEQLPQDARRQFEQMFQARYFSLMMGNTQSISRLFDQANYQSRQAEADKKPDIANAWGSVTRLLALDSAMFNRAPGEKYFGMTDRDKLDDTINFILWRGQADQMGVRLADDDIGDMIKTETLGELNEKAGELVDRSMRERYAKGGYSVEVLYPALGDEFRARIAQLALTGTASGIGLHTRTAPPTELTPQESWGIFKNARTTVRLGLIDVPVKDFVAQVTATPSDDDLKKLFDKYKSDEPAPDRDLPAFKEPRKIQVEWGGAGPELPYYQKAADQVLAIAPALRLLANTDPIAMLLAPTQLDAEFVAPEQAYRAQESKWFETVEPPSLPRLHESSVIRAETVASLIGTTLGSAGLGVPAIIKGPLAMEAISLRRELEARAKFGVSMIGLAAAPDPFGVAGAPFAALPKLAPGQGRPQVAAKVKAELLSGGRNGLPNKPAGLVASDLYTFRGEIMKLFREKGKEAAEKYVADFVKERGIEHGLTAEPRDQYHLGDDAGLAPLKDSYRKGNGSRDLLLRQFGPAFFRDQKEEADSVDGPFIPHKYVVTGLPDEKQFYWWRTEDILPRTPKFEKAKPDVLEAWKLIEARELAKKEAERILEAIKKTPREAANVRDVAAQNGNRETFDLGPMALWMPQLTQTQGGGIGRDYESVAKQPPLTPDRLAQVYNIPFDRIAYPDADMVARLLSLREDPKGATTIVTDKPKQNYYVATLLQRDEPSTDEFRLAYKGSMIRAPEGDPLLAYLIRGRAEEYRKAIVEQLRAEAKVVIHDAARQKTSE